MDKDKKKIWTIVLISSLIILVITVITALICINKNENSKNNKQAMTITVDNQYQNL